MSRQLLDDLWAGGATVKLDGENIVANIPPAMRTPELRDRITNHRDKLIALLKAERTAKERGIALLPAKSPYDDITWRVDAFRERLDNDLPFPLPTGLSIRNLDPHPGRCPCCGEDQPHGQTGRCTRCCLAAARLQEEARLVRAARILRAG